MMMTGDARRKIVAWGHDNVNKTAKFRPNFLAVVLMEVLFLLRHSVFMWNQCICRASARDPGLNSSMSERRPPRPNPMNCSLDLALFSCSLSLASSSSPTSKSCCLFSPQSVYPFGCMFLYLYLCFSFFSSFFSYLCLSICLSICLTVHLCMYLPAHLNILSNFYLSTDIYPLA